MPFPDLGHDLVRKVCNPVINSAGTGFRVRLGFALTPRNDEVHVRWDIIEIMKSLH
jgi:hypothetical protein